MIVSHRHRFIFLAVPRTGTQSVRAALRPLLGADDWEQADWDRRSRLPVPALAAAGHGHISAALAGAHLDPAIWRGYFKFAFVRNPWDRFISCAFFRNAGRQLFQSNPRGYLPLLLEDPRTREDLLFRPQWESLVDEGGSLAVDYVGRFERLQEDLDAVSARAGLGPLRLPHLNASAHAAAMRYYDDELRRKVADFYDADIRQFEYAFPGAPAARAPRGGGQSEQD